MCLADLVWVLPFRPAAMAAIGWISCCSRRTCFLLSLTWLPRAACQLSSVSSTRSRRAASASSTASSTRLGTTSPPRRGNGATACRRATSSAMRASRTARERRNKASAKGGRRQARVANQQGREDRQGRESQQGRENQSVYGGHGSRRRTTDASAPLAITSAGYRATGDLASCGSSIARLDGRR